MLQWSSSTRTQQTTSEASSHHKGATYPTPSSSSTTLPRSRTRQPARMLSLLQMEFCLMLVACQLEATHKIMLGTLSRLLGSHTRKWWRVAPVRARATRMWGTSKILSRLDKKWRACIPLEIFKCWTKHTIIVQVCNRLPILPTRAPQVCPSYKMLKWLVGS